MPSKAATAQRPCGRSGVVSAVWGEHGLLCSTGFYSVLNAQQEHHKQVSKQAQLQQGKLRD